MLNENLSPPQIIIYLSADDGKALFCQFGYFENFLSPYMYVQ